METNNSYLIGLIEQLKSHEPQHRYLLQGKDDKAVKDTYMKIYAYLIAAMEQQNTEVCLPEWKLKNQEILETIAEMYVASLNAAKSYNYERAAALRTDRFLLIAKTEELYQLNEQVNFIQSQQNSVMVYHLVKHYLAKHDAYFKLALDASYLQQIAAECANIQLAELLLEQGLIYNDEYEDVLKKYTTAIIRLTEKLRLLPSKHWDNIRSLV